ncbi:MAG: Mur ligase family protein [Acidobacteria bacterium]|nr:Mur ligase family protein [Acidobacteriota bacterium]
MHPPDELLDWLYGLKGPSLKWDLETAHALAALCGRPDRAFRSLHVAGTNGKGSVAAMAESIARAAGIRAGLYTSPHLVRPEERIRIDGEEIAGPALRERIGRLRALAEEGVLSGALPRFPSFFEMMTAAAFLAFAEERVRFAVIECGLGGRLDATNVIAPLASVVTTVAMDHVAILGPTRADIAREKAGIVKPGIPVLAGWLADDALAAVAARARAVGAPLHSAAAELAVEDDGGTGRFAVATPERTYRGLSCALAGAHQRRNAALAIRAIELCRERGLAVPSEAIAEGLSRVRWPGRMEWIERAGEAPVLLDAAHNPEGAEALAAHLAAADERAGRAGGRRRRVAVFGATEGRDPLEVFAPLAAAVEAWVVTRPAIDKALDPAAIARALAAAGAAVEVVDDPARALERAAARAGGASAGEVLVTGSLYLVGDARRILLGLEGPGHPPRETLLPRAASPAAGDAP